MSDFDKKESVYRQCMMCKDLTEKDVDDPRTFLWDMLPEYVAAGYLDWDFVLSHGYCNNPLCAFEYALQNIEAIEGLETKDPSELEEFLDFCWVGKRD